MSWLVFLLAVVLGAGALAAGYWWTSGGGGGGSYTSEPPPDGETLEAGWANLILWTVTWCPHSRRMAALWPLIKEAYDGKTINGRQVYVLRFDAEASPRKARTYGVASYPTIHVVTKDKLFTYNGGPDRKSLDLFVQKTLAQ